MNKQLLQLILSVDNNIENHIENIRYFDIFEIEYFLMINNLLK